MFQQHGRVDYTAPRAVAVQSVKESVECRVAAQFATMSSLLISHVAALLTLLTLASAAAAAASAGGGACDSAFNCSLNGACNAGACACSPPWSGANCATLTYATSTPASGQNLFTANATANSWNGPIIQGADGTFHLFDPIYEHGSPRKHVCSSPVIEEEDRQTTTSTLPQ